MAIAQFSDDARTEFKLNSYSDKEGLLDAINKISYKGGNTKTGEDAHSMQAAAFLWKHCVWVTDAGRACCWSLLEFQDVGVRAWSRCDTVYECIQAVRLWRIKSVFTAAEIICKSEKDAWSRQIHSVTCTRSNTTPSWRYQCYWAGGDRKQKIKSLWKSVLSSRLCVNMRVCKSSVFMHSLIHGCVCVMRGSLQGSSH